MSNIGDRENDINNFVETTAEDGDSMDNRDGGGDTERIVRNDDVTRKDLVIFDRFVILCRTRRDITVMFSTAPCT